jgi:anti-sigma B factor antagonist
MSLEILQSEKEGVVILEAKGRLTVGPAATTLRDSLRNLASAGKTNVVLDLAGVDYIDSTGLGSLVVCYTSLRKAGGGLRLLHVNRRNIELLVLTKLATVFELFDDEQSAVNSFFPNREIKRFDILNFVREQRRD